MVFGEGQERARLERLRDELGLAHRVRMLGITAEPSQWVEGAEIFALSSRFEGFSNVLMEPMSAALAVVSFDCPLGPGDIVQHEVDGVLVPAEDVAALTDALRRFTADQDLRRRLGNAASLCRRRSSWICGYVGRPLDLCPAAECVNYLHHWRYGFN